MQPERAGMTNAEWAEANNIAWNDPTMTTAQPGQEQRMDDPLCGRCGCYRSAHGEGERCEPVGWTFAPILGPLVALTRPTADLGDDGERLPDVLRAIVAEWERGNHAAAVVLPDGPYGFRDSLNQAADHLILYREARDAAAALVAKLDECAPAVANLSTMQYVRSGTQYTGPSYGNELEALRAVLSRSGG